MPDISIQIGVHIYNNTDYGLQGNPSTPTYNNGDEVKGENSGFVVARLWAEIYYYQTFLFL